MLDKSKHYGEVFAAGDRTGKVKYIQDGVEYLADGSPVTPKPVELPEAPKKRTRRPRKAKAAAKALDTLPTLPDSNDWG